MFPLATAPGAGGTNQLISFIIPLVIMFAVFYFLLIRPQKKKQQTRNNMLNALQKGDKIITIGGLHGTIMELTDDIVVLRVNDVTKLTFDRSAISHKVSES
ncbi:preprotein translocase subunit YajC [Paenibacillus sp. Marseille-P2973]|uniref:preprotein translocase subunit YajC n=1 Tax=Paenibacillus sp. Marseille-P2973 TaxID=1871032 RepID=UPI001B35F053|nr:preprotein translocase subunit YajC [Paenibacillus sp. Marseille-P2973]MBQ4897866.1 preprotein translocase subunit YajC [Paenibacillus sp. Marseille-P2973]